MRVNRLAAISLAILGIVTVCSVVLADATQDARKWISNSYSQQSASIKRKDLKAAFKDFAPDYYQLSENGQKLTLSQVKSQAQSLVKQATSIQDTVSIQKFVLKGKAAEVTVKRHTVITAILNPQARKPSKIDAKAVEAESWLKTSKGWSLKKSHTLSSTIAIDGKKVNTNSGK